MSIDFHRVPTPREYLREYGTELRRLGGELRGYCPICFRDLLTVKGLTMSCDGCGVEPVDVVDFHARMLNTSYTEAAKILGCWRPDAA